MDYRSLENQQKFMILPSEYLSPSDYFQNLINQMRDDIYPLFRISGGAPFTVARNVFCFIDHVSQLLFFEERNQNDRLNHVICELGSIDNELNNKYKKYSNYLIQALRHDIVHNIRPFPKRIILESSNDTAIEAWYLIYTICDGMPFDVNLNKMLDINNRNAISHLNVNEQKAIDIDSFSLFFDVVIYLKNLKDKLENDNDFRQLVTRNYYKIFQKNYIEVIITE